MCSRIRIILFSLICINLSAQTVQQVALEKINPALLNNHWKAQWITHPSESLLEYGVFHFRKSFDLREQPHEFIIHISADNRYRLFVNGRAVCFGPARGDLEHWPFESIDIAPFLKQGKNILAAVVWNFGELKPWAQFTVKTAFIVQGNSTAEEIANTDVTWKVIKDPAYSPAPASSKETSGQFVVVGPCDRVDASLYPWGWETTGYDDHSWLIPRTLDTAHPRGVGTEWAWNNESGIGGVPAGGMKDGNSSILSMQFAYAAQRASELFKYFGHSEQADKYSMIFLQQ